MTNECTQLLAEALKRVTVRGSFCPREIGAKAGLTVPQAETAARALSNMGVLTLGFDWSAEFTPDYKKAHSPKSKLEEKAKKGRKKAVAAK